MNKVNAFDVFKRMTSENNEKLQLAPISNIIGARKVKAGTQVTIGVAGDIVGGIATGKYVGGLILCDSEEFRKIKALMETEGEVPTVQAEGGEG